jgi:mono/diheme cytochrome c family protein
MSKSSHQILRVAPLLCFLASCASESKPVPLPEPATIAAPVLVTPPASEPGESADEDEDEVTGKSLYQRHCAGCHNDNGDGRGATMLQQGKQARSFAQGGFAFGNTVEQIAKTIASGIPGSSPMQAFQSVMDEDEMKLVAEYVLTLTPYKEAAKAKDSVMVVGDRAVFAYGKLPPIREGLPEHPRGLMVGLPGGLSFEYDVANVRLLAVRRGAFVDREDWNERGGGYLKPLGELVWDLGRSDSSASLSAHIDSEQKWTPIELELVATRTGSGERTAQLEYRPKADALPGVQRIVETVFTTGLTGAESFGRELIVDRSATPNPMMLTVMQWSEDQDRKLAGGWQADGGWIVLSQGEHFDCVRVEFDPETDAKRQGNAQFIGVSWNAREPAAAASLRIRVVVARVKTWDEALLARWTKELSR